ncbi:MAG: sigma-70 family RNA polymerase sigma factor [Chloroflexi bacterium]|nr:sigma-70 family RNA polymerase sigma factor [Chloroflexota bacterium]
MNEIQAVKLCQEGHKGAFKGIVEQYGDLMYGTALMMTRDRMLAEDIVQDALILAWKSIRKFEPGTNLKAWLMTILVNRVKSIMRRRRPTEISSTEYYEEPYSSFNSLDAVITAEDADRIRSALSELPFEPRQAVVLRFYAEMSVPEIARTLGWKEGTVKSRLHRALRQLQGILEPLNPDLSPVPVLLPKEGMQR